MQLEALFESSSDDADDESEESSNGSQRLSAFHHLMHDENGDEAATDEENETNRQSGYGRPQHNSNNSSPAMGCLEMMSNAPDNFIGQSNSFLMECSQTPSSLHAKTRRLSLEFNSSGPIPFQNNADSPPSAPPSNLRPKLTIHAIMEQEYEEEENENLATQEPTPQSADQSTHLIAFEFHSGTSSQSSSSTEKDGEEDEAEEEQEQEQEEQEDEAGEEVNDSPPTSLADGSRSATQSQSPKDIGDAKEESESLQDKTNATHTPDAKDEGEIADMFSTPAPGGSAKRQSLDNAAQVPGQSTGHCDVDIIIQKLLEARNGVRGREIQLPERQIMELCHNAQQLMMSQPMFFDLSGPIHIVGDVHGQYYDLLRLFELGGFPPETNYLFLGDYVDRGHQSLETICLLLAYKLKYPENFFILRGNHESSSISRVYGFFDECKRRYTMRVWKTFCDLFNCFPVAARIDDMILCMHGGLSPDLRNFEQLKSIVRPTDVPDSGLLCDILWSDPDKNNPGWGVNDRGLSYTFGADVLQEFLCKHEMDMVIRAHQVVEDGYEFFANRQCVTVFSAPNYCGEYDNGAAVVAIDQDLYVSILLLSD